MANVLEMESLQDILKRHIPTENINFVQSLIYGPQIYRELELPVEASKQAENNDFELKGYHWPNATSNFNGDGHVAAKVTRVALFQNAIQKPTSSPIEDQRNALLELGKEAIKIAAMCGVNVFCFQEIWNMPVAFCTQKKLPWVEFAENAYNGATTTFLKKLARKHKMVIISPILEREENDSLWNTAVVIDEHGECLGISRKNHIPISGKFSEASYYNHSNLGHPVFQTGYGRLAVSICYERHHPQSWLMYGVNEAQIVFNPSATVKTFSEHLWPIEARDAAIKNKFYTCAINRVGIETFDVDGNNGNQQETIGPFFGSSFVTAPDGSRTPSLSCSRNGILISDLVLCNNTQDKTILKKFNVLRK